MSVPDESWFGLRDRLWAVHPAVTAKAIIPTPTVMRAYELVKHAARRHRNSIAFWAHPLTGKSSCITAMQTLLQVDFPGCSTVVYEAKKKRVTAEGTFLEDLLRDMDYEPRIARSVAGKRDQVKRALYALGVATGRLLLFIDEAQELSEDELCWLKAIMNWLFKKIGFVTIVLFGQQELVSIREAIIANSRSDLDARYTASMFEFEAVRSAAELRKVLTVYDESSEFPADSGKCYTEFLWPRAYAAGLRLQAQADPLWQAFQAMPRGPERGHRVSMQWIAAAIAEVADGTKNQDMPTFALSGRDWVDAIRASGYLECAPVLDKLQHGTRRTTDLRDGT